MTTPWTPPGETQENADSHSSYVQQMTVSLQDDVYSITAENTLQTGAFRVTKIWDDNENRDDLHPAFITVRLYRDDLTTPISTQQLRRPNHTIDWTGLPVYRANSNIKSTYRVEEASVSGYTATYTVEALPDGTELGQPFELQENVEVPQAMVTIENKHEPKTFDLTGSKIWIGDRISDALGARNAELTFTLQYRADENDTWQDVQQAPIGSRTDSSVAYTSSDPKQTVVQDAEILNPIPGMLSGRI